MHVQRYNTASFMYTFFVARCFSISLVSKLHRPIFCCCFSHKYVILLLDVTSTRQGEECALCLLYLYKHCRLCVMCELMTLTQKPRKNKMFERRSRKKQQQQQTMFCLKIPRTEIDVMQIFFFTLVIMRARSTY